MQPLSDQTEKAFRPAEVENRCEQVHEMAAPGGTMSEIGIASPDPEITPLQSYQSNRPSGILPVNSDASYDRHSQNTTPHPRNRTYGPGYIPPMSPLLGPVPTMNSYTQNIMAESGNNKDEAAYLVTPKESMSSEVTVPALAGRYGNGHKRGEFASVGHYVPEFGLASYTTLNPQVVSNRTLPVHGMSSSTGIGIGLSQPGIGMQYYPEPISDEYGPNSTHTYVTPSHTNQQRNNTQAQEDVIQTSVLPPSPMMRVGNEVLPMIWYPNPNHHKKFLRSIYYWVDEPVRASLVVPGSKQELYLFFRELGAGEGRIMLEIHDRKMNPDVSPSGAWRTIRERWQRYQKTGRLPGRNNASTGETNDSDEEKLIRKWVRDQDKMADGVKWVFLPSMANRGIVFQTLDVSADTLREYCLTNRRRGFRPFSEWSEWGVQPSWRKALDASEYPGKSKLKHAQAFGHTQLEGQGLVGKKRMNTKQRNLSDEEDDDVGSTARPTSETEDKRTRRKGIMIKSTLSKKQVAKSSSAAAGEPKDTMDLRLANFSPRVDIPTVSFDSPAAVPRMGAPGTSVNASDSHLPPPIPVSSAHDGLPMYPGRSDDAMPFRQREASVYHANQMYPNNSGQPFLHSSRAHGYPSYPTSGSLQNMAGYHVYVRGFPSTAQSLRIFMDLDQNSQIVPMPDGESFTVVIPDADKTQDIIRDFKDYVTQGMHISAEYVGFAYGANMTYDGDLTGV